jgi:aldose 1-epimerase
MIARELWGRCPVSGKEIYRYTIENGSGARVQLSSLGAGVVAITVPDREGALADVVLGYPHAGDYYNDGPCAGKVPGRYANRIAEGRFTLDGTEYHLPINNGPNHLHGGPEGFQNQVWDSAVEGDAVVFTYRARSGEMGYPGELLATARYEWSDADELTLALSAKSTAPTVVNLTNHTYFNLNGEGTGSVLEHTLKLKAANWLPTSDSLIPTGEIAPVAGTPMDFTSEKPLGRDIKEPFAALEYGKGYDNCWVIDNYRPGVVQEIAQLYSEASGRELKVSTSQPGVQVYTGNWLAGCPKAKSGVDYADYDGVAIECQNFPDAPNKPGFPSAVLRPGETYRQYIKFAFGVRK